jgi:hypothetical protein
MEAAEKLHENMWGQSLDDKLKVVSGDGGRTWKYLPKEQLDSLQLDPLGYSEDVLFFLDEYDIAMKSFDPNKAMTVGRRGVVVTGQLGIGTVLLTINSLLIITYSQENRVFSTICYFDY